MSLVACQDLAAPISNAADSDAATNAQNPQAAPSIDGNYIVILNPDVADVDASASALEKVNGANHRFTYRAAFKGFRPICRPTRRRR